MRIIKKSILLSTVAGFSLLVVSANPALAVTTSATILVSATALSTCLMVATPMVFGNYAQAVTVASATLSVTCTATTPYTISLDKGTTANSSTSNRLLYNITATSTLAYSLFSDSARTVPWTSNAVAGTGSGLLQTVYVYGSIAANLLSAPGAYLDTVTATLAY